VPRNFSTLRFGTFLAPNVYPAYEFIANYVGRALGVSSEIVVGESFDQFEEGDLDVGFICGLPYVYLTRQETPPVDLVAAPVLKGSRYRGEPIYYSDVIVRNENGIQSFEDLRDRSWAYNEPLSHSGYNVVRHRLIEMSETGGYFSRVVQAGWHQTSLNMVLAGEVDATAIDTQVLEVEMKAKPKLSSQLRVVDSLGPSTIQPVVAASRLDAELKRDIAKVFIELAEDQEAAAALDRGRFLKFVPIDDSAYDDIRRMLAAAEDSGFMEIR
jgi:phosphonate transport system substrate-binding protein